MKIIQKHIKLILSTLIIVLVLSSCASNKRTTMKPRKKRNVTAQPSQSTPSNSQKTNPQPISFKDWNKSLEK